MYMLYKVLIILCLWAFSTENVAQPRFTKGDKLFSFYGGVVNPAPFTFSVFSLSGQGSPSPSITLNYQHALSSRFMLGPFVSYFKVDASITNTIDDFGVLFNEPDLNSIINNLDCIVLGDCEETTITERNKVLTFGA